MRPRWRLASGRVTLVVGTQAGASHTPYVEHREEAYWVAGTRVSLDSIVYAFWRGQTPESIAQSFPTLTLEQVYGAVTFYLANRDDIDVYLAGREKDFDLAREKARAEDPAFYAKLAALRRRWGQRDRAT